MARYTSLIKVAVSIDRFRQLISDILRSCRMDIIYSSDEYLVAREIPGHVSYTRLVTVEVLIEQFSVTDTEVQMSFVVKNEELPLNSNNHCRQMFNLVHQAIAENRQWHLIESAVS